MRLYGTHKNTAGVNHKDQPVFREILVAYMKHTHTVCACVCKIQFCSVTAGITSL